MISSDDAAKESNLPSRGLPGPASFEDRMGHQARAAPPVIVSAARSASYNPCSNAPLTDASSALQRYSANASAVAKRPPGAVLAP